MRKCFFLFFLNCIYFDKVSAASTFLYQVGNVLLYTLIPKRILSCLHSKSSYHLSVNEKNNINDDYAIIPMEAFYKNLDVFKYETKEVHTRTREGYMQILKMIVLTRTVLNLLSNYQKEQEQLIKISTTYISEISEEFSTGNDIQYNSGFALIHLSQLIVLIYNKYIHPQYTISILLFTVFWILFILLCIMVFGQLTTTVFYLPLTLAIIFGYIIFNCSTFIFDPFMLDVILPTVKNINGHNNHEASFKLNSSSIKQSLNEETNKDELNDKL